MWIKKSKRSDFRVKLSITVVLGALVMFALFRLMLLVLNYSVFESLSAAEIIAAFWNGMRFDLSVIALFIGPVILLFNLPVNSVQYVKTCVLFMALELMLMAGFLTADLIYFPYVQRHIGEEIVQLSAHTSLVLGYMFTKALLPFLLLIILLVVAGVFVHKIFKYRYVFDPYYAKGELTKLVVCLLFIILGVRGHLGFGKPLAVADVYRYADSPAAAALTMNGLFNAYQVGRKAQEGLSNDYSASQAIARAQQLLITEQETVLEENYPLMRKPVSPRPSQDINFFIVLLKGWHPYYVDSLSGNHFGVTPVFDQIVKDGVNFTNAYAAATDTRDAFAAVLTAVPDLPGLPSLGDGLEQNRLFRLPGALAAQGWHTFLVQTGKRHNQRLDIVGFYLGIQKTYGRQDIKKYLSYLEKSPSGYDYEGLMLGAEQAKHEEEKSFMGLVLTGITQAPFVRTLEQFDKYKGNTWDDGFKNTLYYADWSIGELLKRAKEEGWFDNTVFVFVADYPSGGPDSDSLYNKFRIPLVLYAPKLLKPRMVRYVVSQLDIVPTLYNLAGLNMPYSALGRDMLDGQNASGRAAFVVDGENIGLITQKGAIRHSRKELVSEERISGDFNSQEAEEILLSLDKAAYTLLKNNRWYTDEQ